MPKRILLGLLIGLTLAVAAPLAASAAPGVVASPQGVSRSSADHNQIDVSTKPKESNKELFTCAKEVVEGSKTVDDCQKAPSIIVPATNELIWGALAFIGLFLALWKFAWPGMKKGLDGRSERIRTDLEAADQAKVEAQQVQAAYHAQLAESKAEGARIIEDARQTADATKVERQRALEREIAESRRRAATEIEAAKVQAMSDLQNEVASIAIGAAEQIVEHSLDQETNQRLVENFIAQVGASS